MCAERAPASIEDEVEVVVFTARTSTLVYVGDQERRRACGQGWGQDASSMNSARHQASTGGLRLKGTRDATSALANGWAP